MDLYLIRHADAVALGEGGLLSDEERPLTDTGIKQARELAQALQRHGVLLDSIVYSPLVRARQTAEELLKQWRGPAPELAGCEHVVPGFKPKRLSKHLRELGQSAVGIVGHQPDLADYAAWLIGSKKAQLDLGKSGTAFISCVEGPRKGAGTLMWLVTPEWITGSAGRGG